MQKSPKSSWVVNSIQPQSPQKSIYRVKQLERQIYQYKGQLSVKNQQIEYLNQKNSQLIQNKSATSLKQPDNIYQSSLEKQVQRLNFKIQQKTKQYQKLHQKHITLQNQMTTLQDFAADLDRQRKFLADKLANIEIHTQGDQVVGELQNKLVLMSTQIMRLGQLNRTKNQENSDLKFKLKEREQQKQLLENQLTEKQKIVGQYRQKIRTIERKLNEMQVNKQYQNQSTYKILSTQIQRLNIQLHNKMQEINTLEHKNKVLENKHIALSSSNIRPNNYGQLQIQIQRLTKIHTTNKQQMQQLQTDIKKQKKQNTELLQNNQKYKRTIKKLQDQLQQKKKNYIKDQNQKIKIQIQTSQRTIREQRNIIEKLQMQAQNQFQQRQQQIRKKFQEETSNMKIIVQQSQGKCSSLYADLRKYEEKLVMLSQQVERLSSQNMKFQQQNAQLKRLQYRIETKQRQLKQILRNRQSTQMQLKRDKQTIQRLRLQLRESTQKTKQLQSKQYKLISFSNQIQILTDKLQTKQRQCKLFQQKLQQQTQQRINIYRIQDLENQLESERKNYKNRQEQSNQYYQKQIQNMKQFITKLQIKIRQLSSEQSTNQSNYLLLADQIKRLNEVLSTSSQTIITQKKQITLLQNNLITSQRSIQKIKSLHTPNQKLEQQIKTRTQLYVKQSKIYQQENINLKKKVQEFIKNSTANQQQRYNYEIMVDNLKQSLKQKQQQLMKLIQQLKKNKQSEDYLIMLVKDIKQSNTRLQKKLADIQQDYIKRLQQLSTQKNKLQNQYISYNRKIRQIQSQSSDLKFQLSTLTNKIQILLKRQKQLQKQNQKLQNIITKQNTQKNQIMQLSNHQLKDKIQLYEQQIINNAKYIGQLQTNYKNKCQQLSKIENDVKLIEEERYRIQNINKGHQQQKRMQYQLKNQQYRMHIQRKQQQLTTIRQQHHQLKNQLLTKDKTIQQKSQLIHDHQNKLTMLSQQLQRINTLIYQKNSKIQQLQLNINCNQKINNKENKNTMEIFSGEISRLNAILCQNLEQIKQLQLELGNKNREMKRNAEINKKSQEMFKEKIFQLEQQIDKIMRDNHKLNASTTILTKKIQDSQKIQKQNEQLKSAIIQTNSQKTKLKNIITDLQSQITTLKYSYQNNLQQQHTSLHSKATLKVSQVEQIKRQLQRKVSMLVSQNQQLVSQIQKLRKQLEINDDQCTNNKKQLIRISNQNVNLIRQKQKYRIMNEQILNKFQHLSINKTSNITMQNTQKQTHQYRLRQQSITKQYQNQIIMNKVQLEKSLKRQNNPITSSNPRPNSKGIQNQLQQKYNILESIHLKLKRDSEGWREKVIQYQFKMKKLKGQFQVINKLTHQYKDQNQYLRQQNHSQCVYVGKIMQNQAVSTPSSAIRQDSTSQDILVKQTLASQIDRLGVLNVNLRRQIEDLRSQTVDTQSLKSKYDDLMAIFVIMVVQIQSLRQR